MEKITSLRFFHNQGVVTPTLLDFPLPSWAVLKKGDIQLSENVSVKFSPWEGSRSNFGFYCNI